MKKILFSLVFTCFFASLMSAQTNTTTPKGVIEATTSEMSELPTFPGGDAALSKYLSDNVKTPSSARKSGSVTVYLIVDEKGQASGHRIFRSIGSPDFDNAALDAVKSIRTWNAGKMGGQIRKMGHKVEVQF
jgi:periplasmic protein TonB